MCHIHTSMHLVTRGNNKILCTPPPHIRSALLVASLPNSEQINHPSSNHTYTKSTPKHIHHHYAPPPLCNTHDTHRLFNCTTLSHLDLWTYAACMTAVLARWTENLDHTREDRTPNHPPPPH